MNTETSLAGHFARLVWLLSHEPGQIDGQKVSLRALVTAAREGEIRIRLADGRLCEVGGPPPSGRPGEEESELAARLALELAREPGGGLAVDGLIPGVASGPGAEREAGIVIPRGVSPVDLLATARRLSRLVEGSRAEPDGVAAPGATHAQLPRDREAGVRDSEQPALLVADDPASLFFAFTSAARVRPWTDVAEELDGVSSVTVINQLVDELVSAADDALHAGDRDAIAGIFHAVILREPGAEGSEQKRALAMAIRRLAKPSLLRSVAELLPARRRDPGELLAILARAGEDGAEAVIELLIAAQGLSERRTYFDVLVQLNAGTDALIHMLGDTRWFVARNAADLLGEIGRADGEGPLIGAISHADDRVRTAAASALTKLGTPKAIEALRRAVADDASPRVRMSASAGLAARRGSAAVPMLVRLADDDPDPEVQAAAMLTLGRLATREALAKLVRAAEPEGRFFNRKPLAVRLNAISGLAEARTPEARAALRALAGDREKEVRDAVARLLVNEGDGDGRRAPAEP